MTDEEREELRAQLKEAGARAAGWARWAFFNGLRCGTSTHYLDVDIDGKPRRIKVEASVKLMEES